VLLNITSGQDEITVDEVGVITDIIMDRVGGMVNVIWGTCTDESLVDEIRITLIATGFSDNSIPEWITLNPPVKKKVALEAPEPVVRQATPPPQKTTDDPVQDKILKTVNQESPRPVIRDPGTSRPIPGDEKQKVQKLRELNYRNLGDQDMIDEAERIPAYKRKNLPVEQRSLFEEDNQSRLTLGPDGRIRAKNSFLHDVAD
jgi:cell division protein FtsZ